MRRLLLAILVAIPAAAQAQTQVGLNLGLRTRSDAGKQVNGTQLEGMIVRPIGTWKAMALLAFTQMRNSWPTGGAVRENGIEATLLFRRAISGGLGWAAGPAIGYATGCASGGTGGITYGATTCIQSFADKGTVRPGYALQLDWERANARGAVFRTGVRAIGHTTAAGSKTPKPAVWIGFTLPIVPQP
jgi:hypothetical protein